MHLYAYTMAHKYKCHAFTKKNVTASCTLFCIMCFCSTILHGNFFLLTSIVLNSTEAR